MSKIRLYLDNCCFNRPYDAQTSQIIRLETESKLYIQMEIYSGRIELVWSFMLDFENEANPYLDHKEAIVEWEKIATTYIGPLETVRTRAKIIETTTGIKSKDALHLSCAIEAFCDYFITTDRQLLKKAQLLAEIKTVNPLDFIVAWEETS